MYLYILWFHITFSSIFAIYIIIDRVYIRNFVEKEKREVIYKRSRLLLLLDACFIVISGIYLVLKIDFTLLVVLKISTAFLLLYGFFNCPFYMKKQECEIRKFMYRFGVLILLVSTILLGIYI